MNEHSKYVEWLPMYVSGTLDEEQRRALHNHIAHCAACRSEVELWQAVADTVSETSRPLTAPPDLAERALVQVRLQGAGASIFRRAYALIMAQVPLVRSEMWPASAAVMALGVIVATIVHDVAIFRMLAPMVAAASIVVIYGPENDPGLELALATTTSPWKILLARLTLVFGYNLLLALAASFGMLLILPPDIIGRLILDWLAPMTFLSAAALVLALWMGTGNAVLVTYIAWLVRFLPDREISSSLGSAVGSTFLALLDSYRQFWMSPLALIALAAILVVIAIRLASHQELRMAN